MNNKYGVKLQLKNLVKNLVNVLKRHINVLLMTSSVIQFSRINIVFANVAYLPARGLDGGLAVVKDQSRLVLDVCKSTVLRLEVGKALLVCSAADEVFC